MLIEAEAAAKSLREEDELSVEIIVPSLISPFPAQAILERIQRCPRLIIAEEGPRAFSAGAEIAAQIMDAGMTASIRRIGTTGTIIPAARHLERLSLPDAHDIARAALDFFGANHS